MATTPLLESTPAKKTDYKELNPFGDVRLSVKSKNDKSCDFRVVSYQLMAASPFFAKLLASESNFAEAVAFRAHRKLEPFTPTINLEDLPTERALECCEVVLRHVHGLVAVVRADGADEVAGLDDLYDLAVVVDYLDCGAAMKGLMKLVVPKVENSEGEYGTKAEDIGKWLFVATSLKLESTFKSITRFASGTVGRRRMANFRSMC